MSDKYIQQRFSNSGSLRTGCNWDRDWDGGMSQPCCSNHCGHPSAFKQSWAELGSLPKDPVCLQHPPWTSSTLYELGLKMSSQCSSWRSGLTRVKLPTSRNYTSHCILQWLQFPNHFKGSLKIVHYYSPRVSKPSPTGAECIPGRPQCGPQQDPPIKLRESLVMSLIHFYM